MSKASFLTSKISGDRIKSERKRLGFKTQADLAEKCGVDRISWNKYENEKMTMGDSVFKAFVQLGADGQFLLTGIQATDIDKQRATAMLTAGDSDLDQHVFKMMEDGAKVLNKRQQLYDELLTIFNQFDDETMERVRLNIVDVYHANLNRKNLN